VADDPGSEGKGQDGVTALRFGVPKGNLGLYNSTPSDFRGSHRALGTRSLRASGKCASSLEVVVLITCLEVGFLLDISNTYLGEHAKVILR
jgi:hypothetical protein